jgi:hypothetical protein
MPTIITGDPGDSWLNDTGQVWWQLETSLINVCGACWIDHGCIAEYWYLPKHRCCRCRQFPVAPGESAKPFIDRVKVFREMPESEHVHAIGKANWQLLKKGIVDLESIVTPSRVLALYEIVAQQKLSIAAMIKAGIAAYIAEKAYADAHMTDEQRRQQQLEKASESLRNAGIIVNRTQTVIGVKRDPESKNSEETRVSPEQRWKAGLKVLKTLSDGKNLDVPDFGGSVPAMKDWVLATFPEKAAMLSDNDWLLLIAMVMAEEELRKTFKTLKVDHSKAMKAVSQ